METRKILSWNGMHSRPSRWIHSLDKFFRIELRIGGLHQLGWSYSSSEMRSGNLPHLPGTVQPFLGNDFDPVLLFGSTQVPSFVTQSRRDLSDSRLCSPSMRSTKSRSLPRMM
jgi:hypothetical protein